MYDFNYFLLVLEAIFNSVETEKCPFFIYIYFLILINAYYA